MATQQLIADSPEMAALIEQMHDEYVAEIMALKRPDGGVIERWLTYAYDDRSVPEIMIARNRAHALAVANARTGGSDRHLDRWGPGDSGWIACRDFGVRIGVLPPDDPDVIGLLALRDFTRCAYDTILLNDLAIVVPLPTELHVDDLGNLHCATGPAIRWDDEDQEFAWHGQFVPPRMVLSPESYTRDEYLAITNTEERRALGEILGWEKICTLLGATPIDAWTDPRTSLRYELLGAEGGRRFLRKLSPKLKGGGGQPSYVEPVHRDLRSAQAARKWQAVRGLSAEQCEKDPELVYGVET